MHAGHATRALTLAGAGELVAAEVDRLQALIGHLDALHVLLQRLDEQVHGLRVLLGDGDADVGLLLEPLPLLGAAAALRPVARVLRLAEAEPGLLALQQGAVGRDLHVQGDLDLQQLLVLLGQRGVLLVQEVDLVVLLGHVGPVLQPLGVQLLLKLHH